jgi:hypothetical protein
MSEMPSERQLMTEFDGEPVKFIFIFLTTMKRNGRKPLQNLN